jgi:hypothetical protein
VILDEDLMGPTGEVLRCKKVPAKARHLAVAARKARTDGGVADDTATKPVTNEGFDRVAFIERQSDPPMSPFRSRFCAASARANLFSKARSA